MAMIQGTPAQADNDVARRIAEITSENSPLMQQSRTMGLQDANRRGLSNSSMAVGAAQAEAVRAAAPIASQEASLAAGARQEQLAALTNLSGQRMTAIAQIMANENIPADARNQVLRSYNDQFSQITNYLQNLYGARLNQLPPAGAPTAPAIMDGSAGAYMLPPEYYYPNIRGLAV